MIASAPPPAGRFSFLTPLIVLALLFLSGDGANRLLLLTAYLLAALRFFGPDSPPMAPLPRPLRWVALLVPVAVVAGMTRSTFPDLAFGISLDLFFPLLIALSWSSRLARGARENLLVTAGTLQAAVVLFQALAEPGRPEGTFANVNYAALVMVIGMLVGIDRMIGLGRPSPGGLGALVVQAVGLTLTASKSGIAALAAGLAVMVWRLPRRLRLLPLAAVALILATPNPIGERIIHYRSDDPYAFSRPLIWSMAWQAYADSPILGTGTGGFIPWARVHNHPSLQTPTRYAMRPETAHNLFLQTGLDYGIAGLAGLAMLGAFLAGRLFLALRRQDAASWAPAAVMAAAIPPALLSPVFESPTLVLVLFLGILLRRTGDPTGTAQAHESPLLRPLLATLCGILIAAEALHAAGALASKRGETGTATRLIRASALIPPANPARWKDVATLSLSSGSPADDRVYRDTLEALEMAARTDPTDPSIPLSQARLHLARYNAGRRDAALVAAAIARISRAVELDPLNPFTLVQLGELRMQAGLVEEARRDFLRAAATEPNFIAAHDRIAQAAHALGLAEEEERAIAAGRALRSRWKQYVPRSAYEAGILVPPPGTGGIPH